MTRNRSKRQRNVGFETLEGRLALSAGMGTALASHHGHAEIRTQSQSTIPASFKGHSQILNGTELMTTNLRGTIGTDHFIGSGTGTVAGKQFEGGTVNLSNASGTIQIELGTAFVVKVGKSSRQEVPVLVTGATGKYAQYTGITGLLNSWNVPAKPNATASFGGHFNS